MPDDILRYTDLPNAIRLAKEYGLSTRQIVRLLTGSMTYTEAKRVAAVAAPLLNITVAEFMALRRNR
jgi:hypothetical protein